MTKEEVIEGLRLKLDSMSEEDFENVSVLCIVSDGDGVGEMIAGKGSDICNALCHSIVGNEALLEITEVALKVAKKHIVEEAQKKTLTQIAMPYVGNKYKS